MMQRRAINCFFHYSGHGTQIKDVSGDEDDGFDESIIPIDDNPILDDELRKLLADKVPEGAKLTAIFDCCCSGTGLDLRYTFRSIKSQREAEAKRSDFSSYFKYLYHILFNNNRSIETYDTFTLQLASNDEITAGDVIMLSGCRDYQSSLDVPVEEINVNNITGESIIKYGGAMTHAFLEALAKHDYHLTCAQLLTSVREIIEDVYESPQVPQLSCGKFVDIDSLFI